jgi:tetratricopeptide (TPR) repeat protein
LSEDFQASLTEFEDSIPIAQDILGADNLEVLLARYYMAQSLLNLGDASRALSELDALLPVLSAVEGPHHANVLGARLLRALCLEAQGRREKAGLDLNELEEGFENAGVAADHANMISLQALRTRLSAPPSPDPSPDV